MNIQPDAALWGATLFFTLVIFFIGAVGMVLLQGKPAE